MVKLVIAAEASNCCRKWLNSGYCALTLYLALPYYNEERSNFPLCLPPGFVVTFPFMWHFRVGKRGGCPSTSRGASGGLVFGSTISCASFCFFGYKPRSSVCWKTQLDKICVSCSSNSCRFCMSAIAYPYKASCQNGVLGVWSVTPLLSSSVLKAFLPLMSPLLSTLVNLIGLVKLKPLNEVGEVMRIKVMR